MANSFCEGEHTPGLPFESGNVYCKRCGELLTVENIRIVDNGPEEPLEWNIPETVSDDCEDEV